MAAYKHLSLNERKTIEELLNQGISFRQIALRLRRDRNTIAREVLRNSKPQRTGAPGAAFNNCANRQDCNWYKLCNKEGCNRSGCRSCSFCFRLCPDFKPEYCTLLETPPYTCNGCKKRKSCTLEKFVYQAAPAQRAYKHHATRSREGLATGPEEIARINSILSPLLKQGQSVPTILSRHKQDIMLDEKTVYKYIKLGLFDAKVTDLLNAVKMKPRRKKTRPKVEKNYLKGRSYRDFLAYISENPDVPIVQMDSVEGTKGDGEPVLLTIHFVEAELMLAFKRGANTAKSVIDAIDRLYGLLGDATFKALFPLVLADQGSEFSNPSAIETAPDGTRRTTVFFTDPGAPYQKGACENNHLLIRRIIPKGSSLKPYSQEMIRTAMDHINSYQRKKLNDRCPIETFSFFHNPLILEKLGVSLIPPDEVILNPSLLK